MGKVNVIIESDTTPTDVMDEIVGRLIPSEGTFRTRGIAGARVYIVPVDEPTEPEESWVKPSEVVDYNKAAEFIVQNVPTIVPEYVGERLAESDAVIDSWLKGEDRSAALEKRRVARQWIAVTAVQHGYQGG